MWWSSAIYHMYLFFLGSELYFTTNKPMYRRLPRSLQGPAWEVYQQKTCSQKSILMCRKVRSHANGWLPCALNESFSMTTPTPLGSVSQEYSLCSLWGQLLGWSPSSSHFLFCWYIPAKFFRHKLLTKVDTPLFCGSYSPLVAQFSELHHRSMLYHSPCFQSYPY